jgi:hypothetical protein
MARLPSIGISVPTVISTYPDMVAAWPNSTMFHDSSGRRDFNHHFGREAALDRVALAALAASERHHAREAGEEIHRAAVFANPTGQPRVAIPFRPAFAEDPPSQLHNVEEFTATEGKAVKEMLSQQSPPRRAANVANPDQH